MEAEPLAIQVAKILSSENIYTYIHTYIYIYTYIFIYIYILIESGSRMTWWKEKKSTKEELQGT